MMRHPPNDSLSDIAANCLSNRLGVFSRLSDLRVAPDFDFLFAFTVEVCNVGQLKSVTAAGGAFTRERAKACSIGEAIERLGLCSFRSDRVSWASYNAIHATALDPRSCLHYLDEVYKRSELGIARFSASTPTAWLSASILGQSKSIFVPAVFAYNQLPQDFPAEAVWDRPVSTGAACAFNRDHAILTGLYEVIERDTLMLHWEWRRAGRKRRAEGAICDAILARGFAIELVQLDTDLNAKVALAAIIDHTGKRAHVGIGTAARATWQEASCRAIEEAVLCMMWVTNRLQWQAKDMMTIKAELQAVPDPVLHADFYAYAENMQHCSFLWQDALAADAATDHDDAPHFDSPGQELAVLQSKLTNVGLQIIVADITPAEAQGYGLHVVRVLVPGLIPLARGTVLRPLANARLQHASAPETLLGNPYPHPLP